MKTLQKMEKKKKQYENLRLGKQKKEKLAQIYDANYMHRSGRFFPAISNSGAHRLMHTVGQVTRFTRPDLDTVQMFKQTKRIEILMKDGMQGTGSLFRFKNTIGDKSLRKQNTQETSAKHRDSIEISARRFRNSPLLIKKKEEKYHETN